MNPLNFTETQSAKNEALTDRDFAQRALKDSMERPVFVLFHQDGRLKSNFADDLAQALESIRDHVAYFTFNADQYRLLTAQLAQSGLPVHALPLCVVFYKGRILDMLPSSSSKEKIGAFVEKIAQEAQLPVSVSVLLKNAENAFDQDDYAQACGLYSEILEKEEGNASAWAGLIKSLSKMGEDEAAMESYNDAPEDVKQSETVQSAVRAVRLMQESKRSALRLSDLERDYAQDPTNAQLSFELAAALIGAGKKTEGCDILLELMKRVPEKSDEARTELLKYFDAWGFADEHSKIGRRKLSALLFS